MTTGVYLGSSPDARFTFNRAYMYQLSFIGDTNDIDQFGDTFTMWIDRSIGYGITYVLNSYIQPWTSNSYTLDHVVYDCWWHAFFDSVHHPQAFTTNWWWRGTPGKPTVSIIQPTAGTIETFHPVDQAPPTYWGSPTMA